MRRKLVRKRQENFGRRIKESISVIEEIYSSSAEKLERVLYGLGLLLLAKQSIVSTSRADVHGEYHIHQYDPTHQDDLISMNDRRKSVSNK